MSKNKATKPKLSKETIQAIEKARERMKKGKFVTEAEARKKLELAEKQIKNGKVTKTDTSMSDEEIDDALIK